VTRKKEEETRERPNRGVSAEAAILSMETKKKMGGVWGSRSEEKMARKHAAKTKGDDKNEKKRF